MLNLPLDFEFIRRASAAGAPKFMEWYGAFGLMLSIVWMVVSILRLLALLRSRQASGSRTPDRSAASSYNRVNLLSRSKPKSTKGKCR